MNISNCEILAREGTIKGSCCDDCHNSKDLVEIKIYSGEDDTTMALICCKIKSELVEMGMTP